MNYLLLLHVPCFSKVVKFSIHTHRAHQRLNIFGDKQTVFVKSSFKIHKVEQEIFNRSLFSYKFTEAFDNFPL